MDVAGNGQQPNMQMQEGMVQQPLNTQHPLSSVPNAQMARQQSTSAPTIPAAADNTVRFGIDDANAQGNRLPPKEEDALNYLYKVKNQFGEKPHIYNKFLEIMRELRKKPPTLDTPGVVRKVSELFKGHTNLILGFNTFLPAGYKIEVVAPNSGSSAAPMDNKVHGQAPQQQMQRNMPPPPNAMGPPQHALQHMQMHPHPAQQVVDAGGSIKPMHQGPGAPGNPPAGPQGSVGGPGPSGSGGVIGGPPPVRSGPSSVRTSPSGGRQEFDQAIEYVTKIKKRFSNDPDTYKNFLNILHGYQKQQRSIKEVLDNVSILFKDHPDLLSDFTYFLPDAVQEQAKSRIQRTVSEYQKRQGMPTEPSKARRDVYGRGGIPGAPRTYPPEAERDRDRMDRMDRERYIEERHMRDRMYSEREKERDRRMDRHIDRAQDRTQVGMGPSRYPRSSVYAPRSLSTLNDELQVLFTPSERYFFDRVKTALGSNHLWIQFLKCLHMFACEAVNRQELYGLLQDLFMHATNVHYGSSGGMAPPLARLFDEFKSIMMHKGLPEITPEDTWFSMPVGEIDFSDCPRCTPSYRRLPKGYPRLACSARSQMEAENLNDIFVSVPTGSEDFSFKIMRKNQYEDALFKCEDERHEVDMIIENNAATIKVLEPLVTEINTIRTCSPKNVQWQFRLDKRSLGILHLKAIDRIYGEHGSEVLELIRKNPAGALPIVLERLKAKDVEWRKAKAALTPGWKEIMEKNYLKSLDHRSFYFKQSDKKAMQPRSMIAELKNKAESLETIVKDALRSLEPETSLYPPTSFAASHLTNQPLSASVRAHLRFSEPLLLALYRDTSLHSEIYILLTYATDRLAASNERDKASVAYLWRMFLSPLFHLDNRDFSPQPLVAYSHGFGRRDSRQTGIPSKAQPGDVAKTPMGSGVVANVKIHEFDGGKKSLVYEVWLPFGQIFVPESKIELLPTDEHPIEGLGLQSKPTTILYSKEEIKKTIKGPIPSTQELPTPRPADVLDASVKGGITIGNTHYTTEPAAPSTAIFYATQYSYLFFRIHHIISDRLAVAKGLCMSHSQENKRVMHPTDRAAMEARKRAEKESNGAAMNEDGTPMGSDNTSVSPMSVDGEVETPEEKGERNFQHFLTAICSVLDGSMDPARYEDECRELMGSASYLLFTLDKLITAAAKQLISMANDPLSQNLIEYWRHHYLRLTLASNKRTEEQIKEEEMSSLSMYIHSVKQALAGKTDDVYAIQYVRNQDTTVTRKEETQKPLWHTYNASSSWKTWTDPSNLVNTTLVDPNAPTASFSVRYFGKPTLDDELEAKSFEYASALPVSVSRLIGSEAIVKDTSGHGEKIIHNIVLGQESPLIENVCYSTSTESPFGTFPAAWTTAK